MERNRVQRKEAIQVGDALKLFLTASKLVKPHNTYRIFQAWDDASGAERFTLKRYYRDGKLYVTIGSSVVRSQLLFQKDALVEKINEILSADDMYISDGQPAVKELILK